MHPLVMSPEDINQFIYSPDDPRLFSNVSQAISLVDLGKKLLDASRNGDVDEVRNLINGGAPFTTDWVSIHLNVHANGFLYIAMALRV